jgi:hypothetical protein
MMNKVITTTLIVCLTSFVKPFQPTVNIFKASTSSSELRNPFRFSTELLAKKKGSKLISDDFLSSLDQFDETPAVVKNPIQAPLADPVIIKSEVAVKEKDVFIDAASVKSEVEGEEGDPVKKKKKKRDKSKKDYFSNVDLGDSPAEEAGK